jgi:tRNA(Ile)-lysidine synthase
MGNRRQVTNIDERLLYNGLLMDLIKKTRETITEHVMISTGDHVLIGLSGGPDSVCLAVVLGKLRDELDLSLSAVYINHCLRPEEVEKEIVFCRRFCEEWSITFHERTVNVREHAEETGSNIQESARDLRYKMYESVAAETGAVKIALGHNADDQAETVLMRLIRGSGRRGLAGIPPVRGGIIRPLIGMERKDIEEFLAGVKGEVHGRSGQPYIIDTSNFKEEYLRNWIRLSLLEEVKKRNPAVVHDICRTATIIREEDEYLEIQVTKTLMRMISRKSDSHIELFVSPLATLEKPLLRRVLRRALDATMGLRGISFTHIEDIIRLIREGKAGDRIHLPKNVRVVKEYSLLKITADAVVAIVEREIQPPCEVTINEINTVLKASIEDSAENYIDSRESIVMDAGALSFPLKVRSRADGDFFYPLGFGKKKKLQDFFVDEKVPRDVRGQVPVVVSGNDIIWIAGYRADERFKVTEKTERVLKLIIIKR